MIRDTFERNPGLCELFKRKIRDRAQSAGVSSALIDFESQIDMKGTFQENLKTFYREYPQLAQRSDYFKLKTRRQLNAASLERSWRSYQRDDLATDGAGVLSRGMFTPELTVTYTFGPQAQQIQNQKVTEREFPEDDSFSSRAETDTHNQLAHSELIELFLDRVAAIAGEGVAKTILHQVGREIGHAAFHHSISHNPRDDLIANLGCALKSRSLGRLINLEETIHGPSIMYFCTVADCLLCQKQVVGKPSCHILRGFISRWFESHLHKKAENLEATCVETSAHLCIFRLAFAR